MTDQLVVGIASIKIGISWDPFPFGQAIHRRYAAWEQPGPPKFFLRIRWQPGEPDSGLAPFQVFFSPDQVKIVSHHTQGEIDVARRVAEIRITGGEAIQAVDYCLRLVCSLLAYDAGGMMVHAAGIQRKGRVCLFSGPSGSGKTTIARNSPPSNVLNDDLVVLLPEGENWQVAGTPFWHSSQVLPNPITGQLAGIFFPIQDTRVALEPIVPTHAAARLLASIPLITTDLVRSPILVERVLSLVARLPVRALHFLPDPSFWSVIDPWLG